MLTDNIFHYFYCLENCCLESFPLHIFLTLPTLSYDIYRFCFSLCLLLFSLISHPFVVVTLWKWLPFSAIRWDCSVLLANRQPIYLIFSFFWNKTNMANSEGSNLSVSFSQTIPLNVLYHLIFPNERQIVCSWQMWWRIVNSKLLIQHL